MNNAKNQNNNLQTSEQEVVNINDYCIEDLVKKSSQTESNIVKVNLDALSCLICFNICDVPYESTCCHCLICKYCIDTTYKSDNITEMLNSNRNIDSCPNCRMKEIHFEKSYAIERVINTIRFTCPLNNCGEVLEKDRMKKHLEQHLSNNSNNENAKLIKDLILEFTPKEMRINLPDIAKFGIHRHMLKKQLCESECFCNGKKFLDILGDCKKIIEENEVYYKCGGCNLVFCVNCIKKQNDFNYCKHHNHPLRFMFIDKGWRCDGSSLPDNCRSGSSLNYTTDKKSRYRCSECDFDLCCECMHYYNKY